MKKRGLGIIALILVASLLLTMSGCAADGQATNLMTGITPKPVAAATGDSTTQATDFSLRLFQAVCEEGQNTSVSPLSILTALAMTSNGAKGNTLAQMEQVLGMDTEGLNRYLHDYMADLPQGEDYKLSLANSIWFTDDPRFTVNTDFLQINADYYSADIYQAPFDNTTLQDINRWVDTETDGLIPNILDTIPPEAVMYLVNALAFDAEWGEMYQEYQVREGIFTTENGSTQATEFMYSEEGQYLEDENATGFIKYYKGGKYAFVALLPNKGVRVAKYIDSLTGKGLHEMLSNPQQVAVKAAIPKFEAEYATEMSEVLSGMGMEDAFSGKTADLTGLGTSTAGNIFINRVLHKTHITVGEQGTKAGAATVVEAVDEGALELVDPKTVYLDRPFVYMLIDTDSALPFFMGTMMSVDGNDEGNGSDHTHEPAAQPQTVTDPVEGYCGNTKTTLYIDGNPYTFDGDESVYLTDLLQNLSYDPAKMCKCLPEYKVDTEFGTGYGIHLSQGYARCAAGQADLTEKQIEKIKTIVAWAKANVPPIGR